VEVTSEPIGPGEPPERNGDRSPSHIDPARLRMRELTARQMLRGPDVAGATPGAHPDEVGVAPPYAGRAARVPGAAGAALEREALERHVHERVLTTTLERAVAWARSNSFFPATFGLACCAIEMMSIVAARVDVARFGFEAFRASPRQADLLILSGRVSIKMAPIIRRIYDQMLEPKWTISMGACCSSMGVFNNYALVPADKFLPVDVHVPGCPPRPEALMHGVLKLRAMVQRDPGAGWRARYGAVGTEEVLPAGGAPSAGAPRAAGRTPAPDAALARATGVGVFREGS
jgi:NADH-quinone oxidoreductase subunit B